MLTAVPTVVSVGGSRPAKDATTAASARQITAGVASTSTEKLNRSEIKQLHANEGEKQTITRSHAAGQVLRLYLLLNVKIIPRRLIHTIIPIISAISRYYDIQRNC